jgi:hypothetical protein
MPTRPDDDTPLDDEPLLSEVPQHTDPGLAELLDPARWPDDDDPSEVPAPRATPEAAAWLDEAYDDDDDGSDLPVLHTEDAPLPALDDEPTVIGWQGEALVDGERVPMVADPTRATTTLHRPHGHGRQQVRIRLAGRVIHLRLTVADGGAQLVLGRDALAGRFLVACHPT